MDEIKMRVSGVEKSFPGVKALSGIDFAVRKGTVHALCGENGAGKSTLMKIIMGLYQADKGQIYLDEKPVTIKNPIQAMEMGISMVAQELNYVPELSVEENLFLGRLPVNRFGKVDWRKIRRDARQFLKDENLPYEPTQYRIFRCLRLSKQLQIMHRLLLWMSRHLPLQIARLKIFSVR